MNYNTQILMSDGSMSSFSFSAENDEEARSRVGQRWHTRIEKTSDHGVTWTCVHPGYKPGAPFKAPKTREEQFRVTALEVDA
mgnify:CR=1 FL=1